MTTQQQRIDLLRQRAASHILCLDGATGTALASFELTAADFGGAAYDGCNEYLVITRPDVVEGVHRRYLEAGADIIETNSFGSTSIVLREYALEDQVHRLNLEAARIARTMADRYSTADKPRFVAGCMGPTSKSICITGGVTFHELRDAFRQQALALIEGGVDYLLLETMQDTLNLKAGLIGATEAMEQLGVDMPLAVSVTIEPMGTMLAGQAIEALYNSIEHFPLLYVGLNCATGPDFMTGHIRSLAQLATCGVACVPNAGLPDENGRYQQSPTDVAGKLAQFMDEGWLNFVGGCCGTTDEHIRMISAEAAKRPARTPQPATPFALSGIEYLPIEPGELYLVGERTNVIGSRKFKRLIAEGNLDEAVEVARKQIRGGAHIIDVCLANPDRDEHTDMQAFMAALMRSIKVPFMIDSTDAAVVEVALQYSQGKAIINSINLEQGTERLDEVVPLLKTYGAAVVVGTIDEDPEHGMAVTAQRKLEIARRSYDILVNRYGLRPENIVFDPLVFPVATGDEQYRTSARETIEGIALIREEFPHCAITIGLSNVSFGLPPAAREILNAVFLKHCVDAGLTMPIINPEMMVRYASIEAEDLQLAENLIFARGEDPITPFADKFRERKTQQKATSDESLPVAQRLQSNIVEGSRENLHPRLDEAMAQMPPLDVINGPLMAGMAEVGRLFNDNKLIVAEVLQSAEVMKASVDYLSQFMEADQVTTRGTMVLATVKGDVHDIGKNLVDIIMTNNGYKVINLGIKIPSEQIIEAIEKHKPDFVGLSGLLVRSAQQMTTTAADMKAAGIDIPLMVGGAALSENFTSQKIQPQYEGLAIYCRDPMECLALAGRLLDDDQRQSVVEELWNKRLKREELSQEAASTRPAASTASQRVQPVERVPLPPDLKRHVHMESDLQTIFDHINPHMLYGKHLGYKGFPEALARGEAKAVQLQKQVQEIMDEIQRRGDIQPGAVYRYFQAHRSSENSITLLDSLEQPLRTISFPRNPGLDLCLADYVHPERDYLCLFIVSTGPKLGQLAQQEKEKGNYQRSHIMASLALEMAESLAEILHIRLRHMWGIGEQSPLPKQDLFGARYRGKRYAPGYSALPDLSVQEDLFALLHPDELGVKLTESHMMDPEASTSGFVFHHPQARYF
ncbi:methionine synthase [Desulfurispirillum indicum S5]|uniref:Methionine synthase n=1 Tax=Desulfurispirillum indicum (strain ATCC BAA-1389 / DSM 22839 / S5) TaxID=653733 RepID=E6W3E3_DESIS|nr:methionine synthase [Desulfurispirillum indicum]ADU65736.1 methionine synthase [Desulfurispirillum indicum S5]